MEVEEILLELIEILKDANTGYSKGGEGYDPEYNALEDSARDKLVNLIRRITPNRKPGLWSKCKKCEYYRPRQKGVKCEIYDDWRAE